MGSALRLLTGSIANTSGLPTYDNVTPYRGDTYLLEHFDYARLLWVMMLSNTGVQILRITHPSFHDSIHPLNFINSPGNPVMMVHPEIEVKLPKGETIGVQVGGFNAADQSLVGLLVYYEDKKLHQPFMSYDEFRKFSTRPIVLASTTGFSFPATGNFGTQTLRSLFLDGWQFHNDRYYVFIGHNFSGGSNFTVWRFQVPGFYPFGYQTYWIYPWNVPLMFISSRTGLRTLPIFSGMDLNNNGAIEGTSIAGGVVNMDFVFAELPQGFNPGQFERTP